MIDTQSAIMAPVDYREDFVENSLFEKLWADLPWERREDAPRRECWMNDWGKPYTYGRGAGMRTYIPQPWNADVLHIRDMIAVITGTAFEGCFINGYEGPRDHLGWHADDSPEIDGGRPIAVVSLGSARKIMFRPQESNSAEALVLKPGSLLLMRPGMQSTHFHRIPKHSADCGPRISLTFRGLIRV